MANHRTGVIGIGGIGKLHAQLQTSTQRMDVVALCDANENLKPWAKETYPNAEFYTDPKTMFAEANLDLVSVVIPHNLHAPVAIDALNAGVNVITEKPMATTYDDAKAMLAAAEANGKFVTVFHNRRLDPWFLAAKKAIDAGLLGKLIDIQTGINYGPGPQTWRGYQEASGGLTFDWGAHLVDYSLNFEPSEVVSVSGFRYKCADTPDDLVDNHAQVRILFASGASATITISGKATIQPQRYRIVGEEGTLIDEWAWANSAVEVHTKPNGLETVTRIPYGKVEWGGVYDNLADVLDGKDKLFITGESAAKVINVLCTADKSAHEGGAPLPLAE